MKTTKSVSPGIRCPGRYSNPASSNADQEALPLEHLPRLQDSTAVIFEMVVFFSVCGWLPTRSEAVPLRESAYRLLLHPLQFMSVDWFITVNSLNFH
jgi:hypothetical protein